MTLSRIAAVLCLATLSTQAMAADLENWPIKATIGTTTFSLTGNYQYDLVDARHADGRVEDSHTNRRKEFGFTARSPGQWDAYVYFDFQAKRWLDVYWRLDTRWVFGDDYGKLRFGYSKLPVGFEGMIASRANSFLELALPMQAFFESRRTGIDWAFERPRYLINAGYYFGEDLQGDNDGTTTLVRAAWTPRKAEGDVVHLGVSVSVERPEDSRDGTGRLNQATARFRSKPESGLTENYLADSGSLGRVDSNRRTGVEALWIHGPLSFEGEYMHEQTTREAGLQNFRGDGYFAFVSYVLTGESRPYAAGTVNNVKPSHPWGAVELLARYSAVDLDDRAIRGGREHDFTLGANWYLTTHLKIQANYVKVHSERNGTRIDPDVFEMRAQVYF